MKIAMMTPEYWTPNRTLRYNGGLGVLVGDLSRELARLGHEVTVFLPKSCIPYRERIDNPFFDAAPKSEGRVTVDFSPEYSVSSYQKGTLEILNALELEETEAYGEYVDRRAKELNIEVIHAHDWMMAHALKNMPSQGNNAVVATIHNSLYGAVADRAFGGLTSIQYLYKRSDVTGSGESLIKY